MQRRTRRPSRRSKSCVAKGCASARRNRTATPGLADPIAITRATTRRRTAHRDGAGTEISTATANAGFSGIPINSAVVGFTP